MTMSKLDDITDMHSDCSPNCPHTVGDTGAEWQKKAIKDLMLELIGEDEDIVEDYRINGAMPKWERRGANRLRRELRQEVSEL
jgi:hypothetical protein